MASQFIKPIHYEQHEHMDHSPLAEALCQISYPPILKINNGIDADIQEKLLDWPQYDLLMDPVIIDNLNNVPTGQFIPNHQFSNTETLERVMIRNHSLLFSSNCYKGWYDFSEKLQRIYASFRSCYDLGSVNRIGLRYYNFIYLDQISRGRYITINDYINEPFAGPLSGYAKHDNFIRSYQCELMINNDEKTSTRIVYGLVTRISDNREAFLVDIDVFSNHKQSPDTVFSNINKFHEYAYDAFRWVVKNVPDTNN